MLRVRNVAFRSTWEEGRIGVREMSRSFSQHMEFSCDQVQINLQTKSRSWSVGSLDLHMGLLAKKLFDILMKIDLTSYLGGMAAEFADLTR